MLAGRRLAGGGPQEGRPLERVGSVHLAARRGEECAQGRGPLRCWTVTVSLGRSEGVARGMALLVTGAPRELDGGRVALDRPEGGGAQTARSEGAIPPWVFGRARAVDRVCVSSLTK